MGCGASAEEDPQQGGNIEDMEEEEQNNEIYENMEKKKKDENDGDLFGVAADETNEQFMAVKPWIGALKAPSEEPQIDLENAPEKQLELEYVNGYRCEDSRQNLYYTAEEGKIVYMSAAVGVVHNVPENTQTFFGAGKLGEAVGHNDDIESLHVNADRTIAATGQRGKNPSIFVWDIEGKNVICRFSQGRNTRAVRLLKFTPDGNHIFTVDLSDNHEVHVWDIQGNTKVAKQKTGNDDVMDLAVGSGNFAGAVATKRGMKFIQWSGGAMVNVKTGMGCRDWCVSCTFFEGGNKLAAGTTKGDLHIFQGQQSVKNIKLTSGGIHSIAINEGKLLCSGFRDETLKVYDANTLSEEKSYKLESYARSLDYVNGKALVGTRDGQILQIDTADDSQTLIMNGHGTGEAWGLDVHPDGNIITTGDDNKIVNFDPSSNKTVGTGIVNTKKGKKHRIGGASTLSRYPPNQCSRSVAIHPSNGHIAIASNEGELSIRTSKDDLNAFTKNIQRISKGWIEVMAYSPDGNLLAVGTHTRDILMLDVNNNYQQVGKCTSHNAAILNIDWTLDSTAIRSVCNAYELLFFTTDGTQIKSGATTYRDEEYATQSCKLGWWVQGIFPPATDGSHINGVTRSNDKQVIATGDDWGFVNLYKNPNMKGSQCHSYRAHSSHVVRVRFNADDSYVYSIGGYDRCLMKWKVI